MAKAIQTRNGDVASPSGTPSELANGASAAGCDLAQATSSQRHEQSVVAIEEEPRDTVSASYLRFETLRLQFGLCGAATSRDARLVDAEVPDVVCTDSPGSDAHALGSDVHQAPFVHLSNPRRSS